MHQAFAGTSFWVAMAEIPACGFKGRFGGGGGIFMGGVRTGLGALTWVSVFRREIIFLMTHDEELGLLLKKIE